MRVLPILLTFPLLAACSGGGDEASNAAMANEAAAMAKMPPPKTPVLNLSGTVDNGEGWIEPQEAPHDPKTAPYGNILSEPVVNAPSQPK